MFTAVRDNGQAKVLCTGIKGDKDSYLTICTIPTYYIEDLGMAEVIAKTLNEQDKYVMDLAI